MHAPIGSVVLVWWCCGGWWCWWVVVGGGVEWEWEEHSKTEPNLEVEELKKTFKNIWQTWKIV